MKSIPLLLLLTLLPAFAPAQQTTNVALGDAVRLPVTALPKGGHFAAADPKIVQVVGSFAFGLKPGDTTVQGIAGANYPVHVVAPQPKLVPASKFKQLPDNQEFTGTDGRKCFGCELNCKQVESSGTVSNRVVNPHPLAPDSVNLPSDDGTLNSPNIRTIWEVLPDTVLVDGTGAPIGTMLPRTIAGRSMYVSKFQHGMTKVLNGEVHVYSFASPVKLVQGSSSGQTNGVSAWLPLSHVKDKETLLEHLHPGTGRLPELPLAPEKYLVAGGNPNDYCTTDGRNLKIVKAVNTPPQPQDYLVRPAGTINLLYAVPGFGLGGHSLDSFLVSKKPMFSRAAGIEKITVPTYYPAGHPLAGQYAPQQMTFVFGAVDVAGSPRVYGWMAEDALKRI